MIDYRVTCRIDGHPYALIVPAADDGQARAVLYEHWRAGATVEYRTAKGNQVIVQWANVAALEVGPAQAV